MKGLQVMINDNGDMEGIIGLIIAIVILLIFIFLIAPQFCHAMPAPSGQWAASDWCSIFR